jgi:hypothetical protein
LPHRFVDEVIDGALELTAHLLEDLPQEITTLEVSERFLILVLVHANLRAPVRPSETTGAAPSGRNRRRSICFANTFDRLLRLRADPIGLPPGELCPV